MSDSDNDQRRMRSASWISPVRGKVELTRNWRGKGAPPLYSSLTREPLAEIAPAAPEIFASASGYYVKDGWITFITFPGRYPQIDWENESLYVSGDFNGWGQAADSDVWQLIPAEMGGRSVFTLNVQSDRCLHAGAVQFKFVTGGGRWLEVLADAPNVVIDHKGNRNFEIHPDRTGGHLFTFSAPRQESLNGDFGVLWIDETGEEFAPVEEGAFYLDLESSVPLGAVVGEGRTTFRIFAPRVVEVAVHVYGNPDRESGRRFTLRNLDPSIWEIVIPEDLHGWYYHYEIIGPANASHPDEGGRREFVDPYALAVLGPEGPGIIWDTRRTPVLEDGFRAPSWHDLVIVEAHLRDLTAKAPVEATPEDRLGFAGLQKWVESEDFYVSSLGANALELLPIIQFDLSDRERYHWGYMPTAFFAPHAGYGSEPLEGSQIRELQELVAACHRRDIAVILDVVYNHTGEPNHLARIDRRYYFETDPDGNHINWSGTGNTLRCDGPMTRRLVIDSLIHLVRTYRIDGFRFDLAELLGLPLLKEIEIALKAVNPSIILIAEPWSFRGHIGQALRKTGYASWNDGFREFLRRYLAGKGNTKGLRYFLSASLGHLTQWPAQSVNYVESHDDHTWIDGITENAARNGSNPTPNDRRRTHLMATVLMSALGVPMISAGQDFMRSKHGIGNTYLRDGLNALDYARAITFSSTHEYFRRWIRFRLSHRGRLFRLGSPPSAGYLQFFENPRSSALATVYNADCSAGPDQILFAINPHLEEVALRLADLLLGTWVQIADHERFEETGLTSARLRTFGTTLVLPPLTCGLWLSPND